MDRKLKEGLDLIGGKALIKDGDEYYVMLTLKEFRKIKQESVGGLTKQELVDRINNDINVWKVSQEEEKIEDLNLEEMVKQEVETEDVHYEKTM